MTVAFARGIQLVAKLRERIRVILWIARMRWCASRRRASDFTSLALNQHKPKKKITSALKKYSPRITLCDKSLIFVSLPAAVIMHLPVQAEKTQLPRQLSTLHTQLACMLLSLIDRRPREAPDPRLLSCLLSSPTGSSAPQVNPRGRRGPAGGLPPRIPTVGCLAALSSFDLGR